MKIAVQFFVSYARADAPLATAFLDFLTEQLAPSRRFDFKLWHDKEILAGDDWHEEIQAALDECGLGLLLISPAFLSRDYIRRHELPRFLGISGKPVIPTLLRPINLQRHDLLGLQRKQIFRLESTAWRQPKAFSECRGEGQRTLFARELHAQIERRLEKLLGVQP